jgi:KaiC domain protein
MSDDEDWFERAIRENEERDGDGDGESDDGEPDEDAFSGPDEESGSPLEEEFASAVEDAPSPESASDGSEGAESPFGEDFASAFENAPSPESGGGPGVPEGGPGGPAGAGGAAESFDQAEFESAIERIDVGIEGLDDMILGGVPKRSLIAVVGSAGTGKTTFALQFLNRALVDGGRAIYITLEESTDRIFDTATEKGWSFEQYADEGRLAVVHLDPVEMANSLESISGDLPDLIEDFGADRVALDSVSLLEMMYDHPSERRSEVYGFTRSLKEAGVTTLVTSEASGDNPYSSRYGIIEYLADAVFVLQYVRPSDFQETRLAVEIQKIRDANHSRETKPYEITDEGMSVYRQANIF